MNEFSIRNHYLGALATDPKTIRWVQNANHIPAHPAVLRYIETDDYNAYGHSLGVEALRKAVVYDLGFSQALALVNCIKEGGLHPDRSIIVVAQMSEEGRRFFSKMNSSLAFMQGRLLATLLESTEAIGVTVSAAFDQLLPSVPGVPSAMLGFRPYCYFEHYIEQRPIPKHRRYAICEVTGIQGEVTFEIDVVACNAHAAPVAFEQGLSDPIEEASSPLGLASVLIRSAAGHDAGVLAYVYPAAMIFVLCRDSISHDSAASYSIDDTVTGMQTLGQVVTTLAGFGPSRCADRRTG